MIQKRQFRIKENALVAKNTYRLCLEACEGDYVFSGEFVDIAIDGFYLRRPISVCDYGPGWISMYYKLVGKGTRVLAQKAVGETLDLLTGLGKPFDHDACQKSALLVGGGLGSAPLYLLAKELKKRGIRLNVIVGFNRADEVVLSEEFTTLCNGPGDSFTLCTIDGSAGKGGFVTEAIEAQKPEFDYFYTCGPMIMMKNVCRLLKGPGQASLEERMGCGAGFCYGCSCKTLLGDKRICKDGPVFDVNEIIWD